MKTTLWSKDGLPQSVTTATKSCLSSAIDIILGLTPSPTHTHQKICSHEHIQNFKAADFKPGVLNGQLKVLKKMDKEIWSR